MPVTVTAPKYKRHVDEVMEARSELDRVIDCLNADNVPSAIFHLQRALRAVKRARRKLVPLLVLKDAEDEEGRLPLD